MKTLAPPLLVMLYLVYAFFCLLMVQVSLQYIPLDTDVAFLRIKQDYISRAYYRWAFFIHAYSSVLVLPAGFTQFSAGLRRNHPGIHRGGGWLYVTAVLLLAGPSGLLLGVYANGGWSSQLGFCMLGVLWLFFTAQAVQAIRLRRFSAHRDFMIRSFALALSAITLRAWKYVLVAAFAPRPMDVYRIVAWLGWGLNLLAAEWIIWKLNRAKA